MYHTQPQNIDLVLTCDPYGCDPCSDLIADSANQIYTFHINFQHEQRQERTDKSVLNGHLALGPVIFTRKRVEGQKQRNGDDKHKTFVMTNQVPGMIPRDRVTEFILNQVPYCSQLCLSCSVEGMVLGIEYC